MTGAGFILASFFFGLLSLAAAALGYPHLPQGFGVIAGVCVVAALISDGAL